MRGWGVEEREKVGEGRGGKERKGEGKGGKERGRGRKGEERRLLSCTFTSNSGLITPVEYWAS